MNQRFASAKLLLSLVDRGNGQVLVNFAKQGGARGGTKLTGRGLNLTREEDEYGMQDIVLTLMWDEAECVVNAVAAGVAGHHERISGAALLLDVTKALTRKAFVPACTGSESCGSKGEAMESDYMLIVSITNHGEAEALMNVARNAGARGGTILNGMGTGTEEDLKYFGISLAPEKELLVIVSDGAHADAILETLGRQPVFSEPGGGIIFATHVDRFITLSNRYCSPG
ncbi:MAG: P-II family nitrogen regulator [Desulfovibrio sp.]|jgi:nitrogen regulatory protein PII|nr:P-II family nitrogen regulator [Desulfovibrio sp.]